jgi:O-antigen/teichoic acid export membrane protein
MTDLAGLGLRRLLANFGKTAGRQLWAGLLQLATIALIARGYGPTGNGIYTVALLLPTMLSTLLGLGMGPSNVFHLGSKAYGLRAVYRTTAVVWLAVSLLGLSIGAALIHLKAQQYFPGVPPEVLWVALLSFPPFLYVSFAGSLFQGLQDFTAFNLSLSLQPALSLAGVLVCVVLGLPPVWLLAAYLGASTGAALAMTVVLRRRLVAQSTDDGERCPLRIALAYGLKSHLGNIVAFLNYRIDLFLVNFFVNPAAAGLYVIAIQLAEKLWLVSQAVSTVLFPRLSEIRHDPDRLLAITQIVSRVTLAITLLGAVVAAAIAYVGIGLVFGHRFDAAYLPFVLMLPGIVAGSAVRILSSEISARGRPEINLYMALVVVVVNVALNVVLIPQYGINGAAVATSIAYVSNLVLRLLVYKNHTGGTILGVLMLQRSDLKAMSKMVASKR